MKRLKKKIVDLIEREWYILFRVNRLIYRVSSLWRAGDNSDRYVNVGSLVAVVLSFPLFCGRAVGRIAHSKRIK